MPENRKVPRGIFVHVTTSSRGQKMIARSALDISGEAEITDGIDKATEESVSRLLAQMYEIIAAARRDG